MKVRTKKKCRMKVRTRTMKDIGWRLEL